MLRSLLFSSLFLGCMTLVGCKNQYAPVAPARIQPEVKPSKASVYDYPEDFDKIVARPYVTTPPPSIQNYFEKQVDKTSSQ